MHRDWGHTEPPRAFLHGRFLRSSCHDLTTGDREGSGRSGRGRAPHHSWSPAVGGRQTSGPQEEGGPHCRADSRGQTPSYHPERPCEEGSYGFYTEEKGPSYAQGQQVQISQVCTDPAIWKPHPMGVKPKRTLSVFSDAIFRESEMTIKRMSFQFASLCRSLRVVSWTKEMGFSCLKTNLNCAS